MPRFITYASYSHAGIKGLVDAPSDRSTVIKGLVEKGGGKLLDLYMTTGSNDVVLITEVPDGTDAVAMAMAVAARVRFPKWKPFVPGRRANSKASRKRPLRLLGHTSRRAHKRPRKCARTKPASN
jgi:uncharacterized protein with GYD domain